MSIAFHGIENTVVTFRTEQVTAGYPAAVSANGAVADAADGAAPAGIALNQRGSFAAVQIRGFAQTTYSGTAPSLGWNSLVADGGGGLRVAGSGETGKSCLVVEVNTAENKLGVFL